MSRQRHIDIQTHRETPRVQSRGNIVIEAHKSTPRLRSQVDIGLWTHRYTLTLLSTRNPRNIDTQMQDARGQRHIDAHPGCEAKATKRFRHTHTNAHVNCKAEVTYICTCTNADPHR